MMELLCKICHNKVRSVESFVRHFDLTHRLSSSSRFACGIVSCHIQFLTVERFENHLLNFHATPVSHNQIIAESPPFTCPFVNCGYKCNARSSLRVHRKRKHGQEGCSSRVSIEEDQESVTIETPAVNFADSDKIVSQPLIDLPLETETVDESLRDVIRNKFVHFYLSLNASYHVPDSTIQYMINSHLSLAKESNKILKEDLLSALKKAGIGVNDEIDGLISNVLAKDVLSDVLGPNGPLRSSYMRQKTFKSGKFRYVEPKSHKLGLNQENDKRTYHTVPIRDSILAISDDDSVYEQFLQTRSDGSSDEMIRDIHDGSLCKMHPVLSQNKSAIGILLYTDDLEISNPLGAAKGKHKVTVAYFTLSNLQPWSRMKKDVIKLAMIIAEKDVAYFGLEKVLEPLIRELTELAREGIEIRGGNVPVVPIMLLGDNLGTHTLTGFVENFSTSKFFCRYCEESRGEWHRRWLGCPDDENIDSDDDEETNSELSDSDDDSEGGGDDCESGTSSNASDFTLDLGPWRDVPYNTAALRTPESYDQCVKDLERKPSCESVKGIVGSCQFNQINGFHCVGASPPCIAHDLFEGVLAYDVALALNYFKENLSLHAEYINSKIKSLKLLGSDQGDKPAKVKDSMKKLRGSAVQNWNFLRFLPLLVGNKIHNRSDGVWQMMLLLTLLTRVLTSPAVSKAALPVLKEKIHRYLKMRRCFFPNVPLRAKHHFLEHYPVLIERFGCLMRVSTLGFESKHRFLKNTALSKKNFKNPSKLLSHEHQLAQSAISVELATCNFPLPEDPDLFSSFNASPEVRQSALSFFGTDFLDSSACSEKVRFHGTWYRKGECVITCTSNESRFDLCLMEYVFVKGKNCFAVGWLCKAVLNPEWQLFEVKKSNLCTTVNLARLTDYLAYPLYKMNGVDVVVLKHTTHLSN